MINIISLDGKFSPTESKTSLVSFDVSPDFTKNGLFRTTTGSLAFYSREKNSVII